MMTPLAVVMAEPYEKEKPFLPKMAVNEVAGVVQQKNPSSLRCEAIHELALRGPAAQSTLPHLLTWLKKLPQVGRDDANAKLLEQMPGDTKRDKKEAFERARKNTGELEAAMNAELGLEVIAIIRAVGKIDPSQRKQFCRAALVVWPTKDLFDEILLLPPEDAREILGGASKMNLDQSTSMALRKAMHRLDANPGAPLANPPPSSAGAATSSPREWTNIKGKKIMASLVAFDGQNVTLKVVASRNEHKILLQELSEADRIYLQQLNSPQSPEGDAGSPAIKQPPSASDQMPPGKRAPDR